MAKAVLGMRPLLRVALAAGALGAVVSAKQTGNEPACEEDSAECSAQRGTAMLQARRVGMEAKSAVEESQDGMEIREHEGARIIIHEDSDVKRKGSGVWVLSVPSGCKDKDVDEMAESMPQGSKPIFKGHPTDGGLCIFMMEGTEEQVKEEISTHKWPSTPTAEI
mmetsp:Transcript_442/g.1321  ORF Transcript_442/g.1321 Transcript_442/m.1321 type:complete len:165 (-) Transcript_442:22-516(-)